MNPNIFNWIGLLIIVHADIFWLDAASKSSSNKGQRKTSEIRCLCFLEGYVYCLNNSFFSLM